MLTAPVVLLYSCLVAFQTQSSLQYENVSWITIIAPYAVDCGNPSPGMADIAFGILTIPEILLSLGMIGKFIFDRIKAFAKAPQ